MQTSRGFLATFLVLSFFAAGRNAFAQVTPEAGRWVGSFTVPVDSSGRSEHIPVRMGITVQNGKTGITFYNAEETISVNPADITETADSLCWKMPVFDSEFRCKKMSTQDFSGFWINHNRTTKNIISFAAFSQSKMNTGSLLFRPSKADSSAATHFFEGRWKTTFSPRSADSSMAIGIFRRAGGNKIYGTFLTETGDYRYLEGEYSDQIQAFWMSCFDGSHLFMFTAKMSGDSLRGEYYSGAHWHERWVAVNSPKFQLRDPEKLTWIKDSSKVAFTFNGIDGKPVSLSDARFKNKVVIVQVMGSWCPNCMDETRWLSSIYPKYQKKGLEIVALAYEKTSDTARANAAIRRMKNKFGADYVFLNTGKTGSAQASESLPFLNGIMSFPTTIYIDRKGKVRKIYTGFNGPATGEAYDKDTAEALRFIQQLLAEH